MPVQTNDPGRPKSKDLDLKSLDTVTKPDVDHFH